MKRYSRIMSGPKSIYADDCLNGNFICANFDIDIDLTGRLSEDWREFNKVFIPIWILKYPGKSRVIASLSCGALWTIAKGIQKGDIIITPDGKGGYIGGRNIRWIYIHGWRKVASPESSKMAQHNYQPD
jgi:restriction system protein